MILEFFEKELKRIKDDKLYRSFHHLSGLDFLSNDTLGLSSHPYIRTKMQEALSQGLPLSSKASRLLGGTQDLHEEMEQELDVFVGRKSSLIFSSGYLANIGVIPALAKNRVILSDEKNHASLIDACKISKSPCYTYRHNDLESLEALLKKIPQEKLILTESLFSMDGDFSPLEETSHLALKYNALLFVDEAHATGIFGKNFSGRTSDLKEREHIVTLHTGGKALGSSGAFIVASPIIKDYLINFCRSFIYTTAPPPLLMIQWKASLKVLKEEPERPLMLREKSKSFRKYLSEFLPIEVNESPIVFIKSQSRDVLIWSQGFFQHKGFDLRAIRYPTVPQGEEGLRVIIKYHHTESELRTLLKILEEWKNV